ncbi:diphosphomevalonate/mevalonate 3,5-bisphosphate decarboxylase family protein [Microbacterium sp. gxy059]|uniref:diphosphomevalonate decarboxylase n=1 Tax=uncultured bacterium WT8 TaxID=1393214 RepID=U3Q646_9BACT|nr:Wt8.27c [uncultured bacterium WT8]
MTVATARAHPNIALVKYWGKRDEQLMLPAAGSLSLTLDVLPTTTTVELDPQATRDALELNGSAATPVQLARVERLLALVRERAGSDVFTRVRSHNVAPTGAGLASSASGFAALATAAAAAYGLDLDARALSALARRGSGSASRSIAPGLAVWRAGEDDATSVAEPIAGPDIRMVVVTVDRAAKPLSSREGMRLTALTSPFYDAWVSSTAETLEAAEAACRDDDFTRLGRIAESHALRMHAVIQSADPPIRYLGSRGTAVFEEIERLRGEGIEAYATADAGPNVVAITRPDDAERVARALAPFGETLIAGPGPGAHLVDEAVA